MLALPSLERQSMKYTMFKNGHLQDDKDKADKFYKPDTKKAITFLYQDKQLVHHYIHFNHFQ